MARRPGSVPHDHHPGHLALADNQAEVRCARNATAKSCLVFRCSVTLAEDAVQSGWLAGVTGINGFRLCGFGVDAVGAVQLFLELLARCRRSALMRVRLLLQPGGFGRLDLRFGLCGTCLSSSFFRKCFAPLDFGRLDFRLFAYLLCLPLPAPTPCLADRYGQDNKRENNYDRDDNQNTGGAHDGLR